MRYQAHNLTLVETSSPTMRKQLGRHLLLAANRKLNINAPRRRYTHVFAMIKLLGDVVVRVGKFVLMTCSSVATRTRRCFSRWRQSSAELSQTQRANRWMEEADIETSWNSMDKAEYHCKGDQSFARDSWKRFVGRTNLICRT